MANQPTTTGAAATAESGRGYIEWAVTVAVQNQIAGANHGFLIRDSDENGGGLDQGFHSREKGTDNPPQLVITSAEATPLAHRVGVWPRTSRMGNFS